MLTTVTDATRARSSLDLFSVDMFSCGKSLRRLCLAKISKSPKKAPWLIRAKRWGHWLLKGHISRRIIIQKHFQKLVRNIQIAPGDLPIQKPDWLRADIYTGDIYIDCTKRLPFPDNSVDLFFFEHFLEHLHYEPAVQFLSEIYRTLKPSGTVRISVPDLKKLAQIYVAQDEEVLREFLSVLQKIVPDDAVLAQRSRLLPSEFINVLFYAFDHSTAWDFELMKETLETIGFGDIEEFREGESRREELQAIERHGEIDTTNSLYTFSIEAVKSNKEIAGQRELASSVKRILSQRM